MQKAVDLVKVICISGHAQHGKDTSAQIMRKCLWGYGKKVLIIHYADLLKFMCEKFFGWNGEKDEAGRTMLQYIGTDIVRKCDPDFWVKFICDTLAMFNGTWDYVLIPDCRFPNEVNLLRTYAFDVVHVNVIREGYDNGLSETQNSHPSEHAMDGIPADHVIMNSGTISDLVREVLGFIRPLYAAEEEKVDGKNHIYDIA